MKSGAFAITVILLLVARTAMGVGLEPGMVLSQDNWQLAEGSLPPEILKFYASGQYRSAVVPWPEGGYHHDDDFEAGTETNRGKYDVDEKGAIVEKATRKAPDAIAGYPFPDIDPKDPNAGVKVLWNHYYDYWNLGNYNANIELVWLNRQGVDRTVTQQVNFLYYEAQPRKYWPASNPKALFWQMLAMTVAPADVYGTAALSWRFKDAEKRDALWAYVPALRRVRQVSPSNRSDGFLGSDMSQDDGPFFDGKPEDFTWKLVGEKEMLRLTEPLELEKLHLKRAPFPGGGWRDIWPKGPAVGFEDPAWRGAPWAPVGGALAKRPQWVIEGTPKDRYYLYGKIELYIDKGTFNGAWNRKFDWKGELMNSYQILGYQRTSEIDGAPGEYLWKSHMLYRCVYNMKADRATCPVAHADENWPSVRRLPMDPGFYEYQSLMRLGK